MRVGFVMTCAYAQRDDAQIGRAHAQPACMADGMESLNVGVAGSVLMYALSHPQYS